MNFVQLKEKNYGSHIAPSKYTESDYLSTPHIPNRPYQNQSQSAIYVIAIAKVFT